MNEKVVVEKNGGVSERDLEVLLGQNYKNLDEKTKRKFLVLCRERNLNPFLDEVYLISSERDGKFYFTIVVSKDVFTTRASQNNLCDGFASGVVVLNENGELIEREGSLVLQSEQLVGGWATVYRKDWGKVAMKKTVGLKEYGKNTRAWREMPATMISKVALVQALRDAFPAEFSGLYTEEEMKQQDSGTTVEQTEKQDKQENKVKKEKKQYSAKALELVNIIKSNSIEDLAIEIEKKYFGGRKVSELTDDEIDRMRTLLNEQLIKEKLESEFGSEGVKSVVR